GKSTHIRAIGEPDVRIRTECRLGVVDLVMQLRGRVHKCDEGEDAEADEREGEEEFLQEGVGGFVEDHEEREDRRRNDSSDHYERVALKLIFE
ncbi:hypothetical protein PMAYCL1PPCAC_16937, partial [Pristionchus mayeri]